MRSVGALDQASSSSASVALASTSRAALDAVLCPAFPAPALGLLARAKIFEDRAAAGALDYCWPKTKCGRCPACQYRIFSRQVNLQGVSAFSVLALAARERQTAVLQSLPVHFRSAASQLLVTLSFLTRPPLLRNGERCRHICDGSMRRCQPNGAQQHSTHKSHARRCGKIVHLCCCLLASASAQWLSRRWQKEFTVVSSDHMLPSCQMKGADKFEGWSK